MNDCCYKNIDHAIRKWRADYHCPVCDNDVSLLVVLIEEQRANIILNEL